MNGSIELTKSLNYEVDPQIIIGVKVTDPYRGQFYVVMARTFTVTADMSIFFFF